MKLAKTASGKQKIKISKSDWESIGKRAGWLKTALSDLPDPLWHGGPDVYIEEDDVGQRIKDKVSDATLASKYNPFMNINELYDYYLDVYRRVEGTIYSDEWSLDQINSKIVEAIDENLEEGDIFLGNYPELEKKIDRAIKELQP